MEKENTILIKRIIEKNGVPEKFGFYYTNFGELKFSVPTSAWFTYDNKFQEDVLWWYEEVPLSSLIKELMPTEDEIKYKGIWTPQEITSTVTNVTMTFQMAEKMLKTWAFETVQETLKNKLK